MSEHISEELTDKDSGEYGAAHAPSHPADKATSRRERSSANTNKQRENKKRGPEKTYLLITGPNSHEIVEEKDLRAAGARVIVDDTLKLIEGTLMDPQITF
jgi:hypothetical protein